MYASDQRLKGANMSSVMLRAHRRDANRFCGLRLSGG
jgi:hypothetical protein